MTSFTTTVHHTANKERIADIVKNAPFKTNDKFAYLGPGYYLWDNHLELAKYWGELHYRNNYAIIEGKLEITKAEFLDLVGDRADMIYFLKLIDLIPIQQRRDNYNMAALIGILQEFNEKAPGKKYFNFTAIRAVDIVKNRYSGFYIQFTPDKPGTTILNPRIIICIKGEKERYLRELKLVYLK